MLDFLFGKKPSIKKTEAAADDASSGPCNDCIDHLLGPGRHAGNKHRKSVAVKQGMMLDFKKTQKRFRSPAARVLLGIMSASAPRRELLRCSVLNIPTNGLRVLFVVGGIQKDSGRGDVLTVTGKEDEHPPSRSKLKAMLGTEPPPEKQYNVTSRLMLVEFLVYATSPLSREPMIARVNDDAFVQPAMLLAYAEVMMQKKSGLMIAGDFEWSSWFVKSERHTRASTSVKKARLGANSRGRNCKTDLGAALNATKGASEPCFGPFAYPRGLVLMTREAIVKVVKSHQFINDRARAKKHFRSKAPRKTGGPGSKRIDDSVQLGYWFSQVRYLNYITIYRGSAIFDKWNPMFVFAHIPKLLSCRKLPWTAYGTLSNTSDAVWTRATRADVLMRCRGTPCVGCAHAEKQIACAAEAIIKGSHTTPPNPLPTSCDKDLCLYNSTINIRKGRHCYRRQTPSGPERKFLEKSAWV